MKPIMMIIVMCFFSNFAFAKGGGGETLSYDMYAPKEAGNEFRAQALLLNSETKQKIATESVKGSGFGLSLGYARGLSEFAALYVDQNYYGFKLSNSTLSYESKGLSQTTIGVKGIVTSNAPYFYYNVGYSKDLLSKLKWTASETNSFYDEDLRNSLNATLGFGFNSSGFGVGALYKFYMFQDTDLEGTNSTTKVKGGNGGFWKIFAHADFKTKVGLAYAEKKFNEADTVSGGVTTTNGWSKVELKYLQVYAIVPLSNMDLMFDITKWNLKDESSYGKYDVYTISAGIKANF